MTNRQIAAVLFNISAILSAQQGNRYRIRAYRRAARNLLRLRHSVAARVAAGQPLGIPQLGKSLTVKISTLAAGDELAFYAQLCAELPLDQQALLKLRVPGLGPTMAARIQRGLGPINAESLRRAAVNGKLQRVWGIGPKRTAAILDAVGGAGVRQETLGI